MAPRRLHLNRLGAIGLIIGFVVIATTVTAQDTGPGSIDQPDFVTEDSEAATGGPEAVSARRGAITHPLTHPLMPAIPRSVKERAQHDPEAPEAIVLPTAEDAGPLTADVVTSFVGLDRPGAADQGFVFDPPDTIVAASNTRILEGVNNALRLFTKTGSVLATRALTPFFYDDASTTSGRFTDPKVYFDRTGANRRFYIVALQLRIPLNGFPSPPFVSLIHLAVSRSPDPNNLDPANWCRYVLQGRRNSGTSLESWADYPGLGAGVDKLVITTNQFTFSSNAFTFAIIRVLNKLTLANNSPPAACPALPAVSTIQPATASGDFSIFTLQPVQHYTIPSGCPGASNPVYLINNVRSDTAQFNYRVWRVANLAPVIRQGPVTLAGASGYTFPPDAPQAGSTIQLDAGDTRVAQAAGTSNLIEGVHGTGCNIGGGANESCVRYVRFSVGCTATGGISATFNQQFTFGGGAGIFFFSPGTARNTAGQSGLAFQRSSATTNLSAFWAVKPANGVPNLASSFTTGTCAQPATPPSVTVGRTGDYVGAHIDPSNLTNFCFAGERVTLIGGTCQWQTQITCVAPGGDVIVLSSQP